MRSIHKTLFLYFVLLATTGLAVWKPSFTWVPLASYLLLLSGAVWFWVTEGRSIRDLGLHFVPSWHRNVGWGFFVGVILYILLVAVQAVNGWVILPPSCPPMIDVARIMLPPAVILASLAVFEELLFRGYFLQCFSFDHGTRFAVLSSSLLWALLHLPAMVGAGLPPIFIAIATATFIVWGVALGIGFVNTNNTLWFPFGLHYSYNLSQNSLSHLILISFLAPRWWVGHGAWTPGSGLLDLLLRVFALVVVWWSTGRRRNTENLGDRQANIG